MKRPPLKQADPQVAKILDAERQRQEEGIELIPSENYVSQAVLECMGSIFTNKYSEGYPGKRYYGGQENIDELENLAIERAKQLFGAEHVNVQPYSGSPANLEVYFALLQPGDTVLGMKLDQGGHITHGLPINVSGRIFNFIPYGVDPKTHRINMDEVRKLAQEHKPKMIVSGATAYPRPIDFKAFAEIAAEVGAYSMADISHIAGLVAGGAHTSPFPMTDVVTTTTHKTLRGPRGAIIMCKEKFAKEINRSVFPGMQGGPHDHITAAKAVTFAEALRPEFKVYAAQIVKNAKALAEGLLTHGFDLVSGGTDNHLILINLQNKGIDGATAQNAMDKAGMTVNKNTVPYDPNPPFKPSGIRLGTPAMTTRGFKETEMKKIAELIDRTITNHADDAALAKIKAEVKELCSAYPLPGV